jgi:hypothetical protein
MTIDKNNYKISLYEKKVFVFLYINQIMKGMDIYFKN